MKNKYIVLLFALAILIKFSLFCYGTLRLPDSKYDPDTVDYLNTADSLYLDLSFASKDANGVLKPHVLRTPGYPVFLALVHKFFKVPLEGVIFIQLLLNLLAAFVVYKTALLIDKRLGILSALIMLYDLPTSVYSLKLMTEALFLIFIVIFIYAFIKYLITARPAFIVYSSLLLAAATYVRPISYYLGAGLAAFIVYANAPKNIKTAFIQAAAFFLIVYSLLGAWQLRNYRCCGEKMITSIASSNFKIYGLIKNPVQGTGNKVIDAAKTVGNYAYELWRSTLALMTKPGTLKYFHSKPLAIAGKVFGYLLVTFWMIGFIASIFKVKDNIYFQFFSLFILYFLLVAVLNLGIDAGERFRVPIMPCLAVMSSFGWFSLVQRKREQSYAKRK